MGNHDRSRSSSWAGLLFIASTASALTLSNFQLITSSGVPIACILVYNTVIPSCTTDDFTQGTTCSASCADGLGRVQDRIREVCDGVNAPPTSVLGQALMGNLVNLLCPAADAPTPSKETTSSTISSTSTSTTSTSTDRATSLSQSTLTIVTATPSRPPPPPLEPPVVSPSFVQSSGPTQTTGAQQTSAPPPTEIPLGGGSPFDPVVVSGGIRATGELLRVSLALTVAAWLLW